MILYHYTTEPCMNAIITSGLLRPSRLGRRSKDVRYGNGQYLSDITPGSLTLAQLSRVLVGMPFQGLRFTHFVAIDLLGLRVVHCRPHVFLVPNDFALGISDRIIDYGRVCRE